MSPPGTPVGRQARWLLAAVGREPISQVQLTLAARLVPVDSIHRRVLKAWSAGAAQTVLPAP